MELPQRQQLLRALARLEPVDCECPLTPPCRHVVAAGHGLDLPAFAALLLHLAARHCPFERLPRPAPRLDAGASLETFTASLWACLWRIADPAEYAGPYLPPRPSHALLRYDRVEVYCRRAARGESLWAADAWRRDVRHQLTDLSPVARHVGNGAADPDEAFSDDQRPCPADA